MIGQGRESLMVLLTRAVMKRTLHFSYLYYPILDQQQKTQLSKTGNKKHLLQFFPALSYSGLDHFWNSILNLKKIDASIEVILWCFVFIFKFRCGNEHIKVINHFGIFHRARIPWVTHPKKVLYAICEHSWESDFNCQGPKDESLNPLPLLS